MATSNLTIIPPDDRGNHMCSDCGSKLSVKYFINILNPTVSNTPIQKAFCNRCALKYIGKTEYSPRVDRSN